MTELTNNTDFTFNENEKVYVAVAMLGSLLGFIPPLVIYLLQKDKLSGGANFHVRNMLNFQLLILCIYAVLVVINIFPILGTLICAIAFPVLFLFNLIVVVIATIKAFEYKPFNYPISYNFV